MNVHVRGLPTTLGELEDLLGVARVVGADEDTEIEVSAAKGIEFVIDRDGALDPDTEIPTLSGRIS